MPKLCWQIDTDVRKVIEGCNFKGITHKNGQIGIHVRRCAIVAVSNKGCMQTDHSQDDRYQNYSALYWIYPKMTMPHNDRVP